MNEIDLTLYMVMLLLSAVAGLAWLSMALLIKVAPKASWIMVFCNVLLCTGLALTMMRSNEPSYIFWSLADVLLLYSVMFVQWFLKQMFEAELNQREGTALLVVIPIVVFATGPDPENVKMMAIVFNGLISFLMFRLVFNLWPVRYAQDSLRRKLLMNSVFGMFGLFAFINMLMIAASPELTFDSTSRHTELWGFAALVVMINSHTIGIVMAWLMSQIQELADKDALTGLWNRRSFSQRLDVERDRLERHSKTFSIIMIDVDHFKAINDRFGHHVGDEVLIHVAKTLRTCIRKVDTLARFGGEEFVVLLPETPLVSAQEVAERMRVALSATNVPDLTEDFNLTASFGVASADESAHKGVLQHADAALYRAKEQGRNRVESYA